MPATLLAPLGLPFAEVPRTLDGFAHPAQLWAAMKLQNYARQPAPSVHLDFDAYL